MRPSRNEPNWDRLFELAASQDGLFTTAQAAEAGYSPQLLAKHLKSARIQRVRRAVYRIVHYPAGEHEDLTALWLWSDRAGVFSHETALALQGLSDALPGKIHLTLPASWQRRRLRVPEQLVLHHADLTPTETTWVGSIPVTAASRTLLDCATASVEPQLVRDAFEDAADRGLLARDSAPGVVEYLKRFFTPTHGRSGSRFRSSSRRSKSKE